MFISACCSPKEGEWWLKAGEMQNQDKRESVNQKSWTQCVVDNLTGTLTFNMYFKARWSGFSKCAFLSHVWIHTLKNKPVSLALATFPCECNRRSHWLCTERMSWPCQPWDSRTPWRTPTTMWVWVCVCVSLSVQMGFSPKHMALKMPFKGFRPSGPEPRSNGARNGDSVLEWPAPLWCPEDN